MPDDASLVRFDQLREALDPDKTVAETVSPGSDHVALEGGRKHVMSYLGDFLFPPRRALSPVRMLSGGERNRLLLARLFARPANVLVLDEPTNDLDIESLELLEAALQDYDGTLLLVSHDRAFLDNVVTSVFAAEGSGKWKEYAGIYRSGEGEYLINRQPCRLRDIRDLFSGTGMGTDAYSIIEQGKVDVLLVTHAHPDHIVDAPAIAKLNSIPLWGAGDLNMALNTLGVLPAAQLPRFAVGGTVMPAPGIKVTATHAEHSSVYVWNNPATGKPDLVLIPIGGHFGMNPADAAYALREIIKPKYAIPMHYGTNPFNRGTPQQLLEALGAAAVKVLPLKPGEKAEF